MKTYIYILFFAILGVGCSSNKTLVETEDQKQKRLAVENKIESNDLKIVFRTANPQANRDIQLIESLLPAGSTSNRILLNSTYYIKMNGDSLSVDLPFYGTQQLPGDYNTGLQGYRFEEVAKTNTYSFDAKKQIHKYKLTVSDNREAISLWLNVYVNGKASLYVNSSHRTAINYHGELELE